MARYTYQAGAHWPRSLIDLTNYRDANNTVGSLVAQIKNYQEAGNYDAAQQIIIHNIDTLKHYALDASAINRYVEELRNLEIYTKTHKQQIFYTPSEDEAGSYAELQDVWIGDVGDEGQIIDYGNAQDNQVLEGVSFLYQDGTLHSGTMVDNGAVDIQLTSGESYMIPVGYHNGGGLVTATGGTPAGGTGDLGTFSTNGEKKGFDVSPYASVRFVVDVPSIMTGVETMTKGNIILDREIQQFVYITGLDSSGNALYSAWFKDAKDKWQKKYSGDATSGITAVSGNTITINYNKEHILTYYAW